MKNTKKFLFFLLAIICWFVLLLAMVLVERQFDNASIQSFSDALWFSIVTLTTVGYGDFFPVSPFGKLIGIIFILLSVGFFSLVISFFVSLIRNQGLPRIRLQRQTGKTWYYFPEINTKTLCLAEDIRNTNGESLIIFDVPPDSGNEYKERFRELNALSFSTSPEELVKLKKEKKEPLYVFIMGENGYDNYLKALETRQAAPGAVIVCETEYHPEYASDHLSCFDPYDAAARMFWQSHCMKNGKNNIVLIGLEKCGTKLLERAFLTNVYGADTTFSYHVFGDNGVFQATHESMIKLLEESPDNHDNIRFYQEPWYTNPELLKKADMILLCGDSDSENLTHLQMIRKSFPVSGEIYLKSGIHLRGINTFGSYEEIYISEQVIREKLMKTAKSLHESYVKKKKESGQHADSWMELPEILRQSNIAAADHLLIKEKILLNDLSVSCLTKEGCQKAYDNYMEIPVEDRDSYWRLEHERWMRFFALYNFRYGKKDLAMKTHPNYLPYEELDYDTRSYDDNEWKLLKQCFVKD